MRIKMKVGLSGPAYTLNPGDEHDFPTDEAIRFIEAGYAVPVAEREIETAVPKPLVETRADPVPVIAQEPFAGKGDHDGNGKVGGSKPAARIKGKRR